MGQDTTDDGRYTRRDVLKAGVAIGATAVGAGTATAADGPTEYDTPAAHVDHITAARDDLDDLRDYAPKLHIQSHEIQQTRSDTTGQYGWIAESDQYDVTAYYYWTRSVTQRSILSYLGWDVSFGDSHHRDHEPCIVFVNPDGTVDSVVCSGGHHYAIEIDGEMGHFTQDRVADAQTHVNLQVVRPWNHYIPAPVNVDGTFVEQYADFDSWLDKRQKWYDNDRYAKTATEAVEDPFTFYSGRQDYRNYWWDASGNIWEPGARDAFMGRVFYTRRMDTGDLRYEE